MVDAKFACDIYFMASINQHHVSFLQKKSVQVAGNYIVYIQCVYNDIFIKVERKAKIRYRYNHVPYLPRETVWESDKNTRKHNTHESQVVSLSQQVITMLHGTDKAEGSLCKRDMNYK